MENIESVIFLKVYSAVVVRRHKAEVNRGHYYFDVSPLCRYFSSFFVLLQTKEQQKRLQNFLYLA